MNEEKKKLILKQIEEILEKIEEFEQSSNKSGIQKVREQKISGKDNNELEKRQYLIAAAEELISEHFHETEYYRKVKEFGNKVDRGVLKQLKGMLGAIRDHFPEINNSALGTMEFLEKSVIYMIYEWIIANPSILREKYPNIPNPIKISIKKRDKSICQICGNTFKDEELQVDHIYPYSLGGSNEEINLMALCEECNRYKSDSAEYYRSDKGKLKIMENITVIVKKLPMIQNFGEWLKQKGKEKIANKIN